MPGFFFSEPIFFVHDFFFEQKIFLRKYFFTKKSENFPQKNHEKIKKFYSKKKIHFWEYFFVFFVFVLIIFRFFRENIFSQKIFFARKKKFINKKNGSEKYFPAIFSQFFLPTQKSPYLHFPLL